MIKQPNPTLKHNQDWSEIDLEAMPTTFIPATAYQPDRDLSPTYDIDYGTWNDVSAKEPFRIAWRVMAATTGYRTTYPSLIPPGAAHVDAVGSAASTENDAVTVLLGATLSSFIVDFLVRASGVSHLRPAAVEGLVYGKRSLGCPHLLRNYLRLNCLTEAYAPLWEEVVGEPWGCLLYTSPSPRDS